MMNFNTHHGPGSPLSSFLIQEVCTAMGFDAPYQGFSNFTEHTDSPGNLVKRQVLNYCGVA